MPFDVGGGGKYIEGAGAILIGRVDGVGYPPAWAG